MSESPTTAQPFDLPALPPLLRSFADSLVRAGHTAYWVGRPLFDWIEGRRPAVFDLNTDASVERLTALFTRAVPIANGCDTVMIPTPIGPIDATPYAHGRDIETELAHRDFTLHAMAYDAREGTLFDPFGGLNDLAAGRLRAVRSATDRLAEDPVRALRAIRLAATHGLKLDAELERALPTARAGLARVPCIRIREQLSATLLSAGVGQAWPLLEHSGIARVLAPTSRVGAGALIALLPNELELRLAGWLRGARARRSLQKLRFSRPVVERVEHLLQLHPIDAVADVARMSEVSRLGRRESARDLDALITLRRMELRVDPEATGVTETALDRLARALASVRKQHERAAIELTIGGRDVMRELDCGPGRHIGRALAYLTEQVEADGALNEPDALRALLRNWSDAG